MTLERRKPNLLRSSPLDEFLKGVGNLPEAQVKVEREIEYVKSRELIYPGIDRGFNPIPVILQKKAGNCMDGFSLMSGICSKFGYKVQGLEVLPEDDSPGHIVCIYNNGEADKFGTAGISKNDFFPPSFQTMEENGF